MIRYPRRHVHGIDPPTPPEELDERRYRAARRRDPVGATLARVAERTGVSMPDLVRAIVAVSQEGGRHG